MNVPLMQLDPFEAIWFGHSMSLQIISAVSLFSITGYALWVGRTMERSVAVIFLVGAILSAVAVSAFHKHWHPAVPYLLLIDTIILLLLIAIALRSDRYWPLYAAAFQIPGVVTHVAIMVDAHVALYSYVLTQGFWIYPLLVTLLVGTRGQHKLRRAAPSQALT